jgi:hypothetical protein
MLKYLPSYFSNRGILLFILSIISVNLIFRNYALHTMWWFFGIIEVSGFFFFANYLSKLWSNITPKSFTKNVFITALVLRVIWVFFSYVFYQNMTGQAFEFHTADALHYHQVGEYISEYQGFNAVWAELTAYFSRSGISDMGYSLYLVYMYKIFGVGLIIPRLVKAVLLAYICVLIYKLGNRNFGEIAGRLGAIFCMLMPNLIHYSGLHLKESEMVFLTVWFIERADLLFRNKKYTFNTIAPVFFIAISLFFFRTILGITAVFAVFTTLMFSSNRVMKMGKRLILTIWIAISITFFVGGKMLNELSVLWVERKTNQSSTLEWRSTMKGGNKFAKYAGGAVFAPLIFTLPFPTLVETPKQEEMRLLAGGNFVKDVLAFFTIFSLFWIIKEKKWRDYLLIGSFTLGYLAIIAVSAFAQSERFHLPTLPFLLLFAGFGVSMSTNKTKMYFNWWIVLIFAILIGWNWFKLAGRGFA